MNQYSLEIWLDRKAPLILSKLTAFYLVFMRDNKQRELSWNALHKNQWSRQEISLNRYCMDGISLI